MNLRSLDNLVKTGQLRTEAFDQKEFMGLITYGYRPTNRYIVF